MSANDVLSYQDYKVFLLSRIEQAAVRGYRARLAKAAGCQQSFFSQAINGHIHLTPDHGAGLCKFLGLDEVETEYFMNLLHLARASTPTLREMTKRKLVILRERKEVTPPPAREG